MAFYIKQNDTAPSWVRDLKDNFDEVGEAAIDLTSADTIRFLMRSVNEVGVPKVDGTATVVGSPSAGRVQYDWQASDTDTAGEYNAEVEITWLDSTVETVPNNTYFSVIVVDDLDDG